jgi:hypothetical protein
MRDRRGDVGDIVRVAKNENGAEVPTVDMKTCVFCELIAGKRPISVIDETEDVLAFMDIQPVNPVMS